LISDAKFVSLDRNSHWLLAHESAGTKFVGGIETFLAGSVWAL
jgi:hypothetical protein